MNDTTRINLYDLIKERDDICYKRSEFKEHTEGMSLYEFLMEDKIFIKDLDENLNKITELLKEV